MRTMSSRSVKVSLLAAGVALALASPAFAGRGSSPEAVRSAIDSGSIDAISAELERAEHLFCPSCVQMVRPLVDHDDARVRRVATWWLSRHGQQTDLFIEAALRLGKPDSVKARNAADVLGSLRRETAVAPLGAALNNPLFAADARASMAQALGRIGARAALPALQQAFTAPEPVVRSAAVAAVRELRELRDPALPAALFLDRDEEVRVEAIYTAAWGGRVGRGVTLDQATERALIERLQLDKSARVRKKAAWALGEIGARAALAAEPLRLAAGRDADPQVRALAAAALPQLAH
jgi:HEAT repeat protein